MKKSLAISLLLVAAVGLANADVVELLTPDAPGFKCDSFTRYWEKGYGKETDFRAVPRRIPEGYELTFTGSVGRSSLYFMLPPPRMKPGESRELFLVIDSDRAMTISAATHYHTVQAYRGIRLYLQPGEHTYSCKQASSPQKDWTPDDLEQIRAVYLLFDAKDAEGATLQVKRIFMKTQPAKLREETRETITRTRRTVEILPPEQPPQMLLADDTFTLAASWTDGEIRLDAQSQFKDGPPKADILPDATNPALVFEDDCQELFFSGANDNQRQIQIVENAKNGQWSARTDWDPVAAAVIGWKAPAEGMVSSHVVEDGWWKSNYRVPFKLIGLDLKKTGRHFTGFQFAHRKQNGKTVVFDPAANFPPPENYGVLVLNHQPFGPGRMTIRTIDTMSFHGRDTMGIRLAVELADMPADCSYAVHVAAPDHSVQTFRVAAENPFHVGSVKDLGGLYTIYLEATNKNGSRCLAANFVHQKEIEDRIGQLVILPKPKSLERRPETCDLTKRPLIRLPANATPRTRKTAELLARRLTGQTQLPFKVTAEPGDDGIRLRIVPFGKPEGYRLDIDKNRILISGNDEPGLYFGGVTLMQILLSPMKRVTALPCLTILDWPDLPMRMDALGHPWHFANRKSPEPAGMDFMLEHLQRYMSDSKMNAVILDLSCNIAYQSHPELTAGRALYDHDDLKRLADWGRDHFLSIIPNWECGGHSSMWLNAGPGRILFQEPGYDIVAHPQHNKIVFDCIREVVQVMRPEYVQFGGDEWWWPGDFQSRDTVNGRSHAQNMLDFYLEVARFCREHNCRPLLWGDMLNPKHNGQKFECWKILDAMPKDFIFLPWAYLDQTIEYYAEKGFTTWCVTTGLTIPSKRAFHLTKGFGGNALAFIELGTPQGNNARTIWNAEYGWNAFSKPKETLTEAVIKGYVAAAHRMRTQKPNPAASDRYETMAGPDTGRKIALIPGDCAEKLAFPVPLNGKAAALVFLHHVDAPESYCRHGRTPGEIWTGEWRNWHKGLDCGSYILEYEDGTETVIPLRLKNTIGLAHDHAVDGLCWDCRFEFARHEKTDTTRFYQYEWINPHPEKTLRRLKLRPSTHFPKFQVNLFHIARRCLK